MNDANNRMGTNYLSTKNFESFENHFSLGGIFEVLWTFLKVLGKILFENVHSCFKLENILGWQIGSLGAIPLKKWGTCKNGRQFRNYVLQSYYQFRATFSLLYMDFHGYF